MPSLEFTDTLITREELERILGHERVENALRTPKESVEEEKWRRLSDLLQAYEKLNHTPLFEARRSYLLGLDPGLQTLLVQYVLEE